MKTPRVNINLKSIMENAEIMRMLCQKRGINITGVVKGAAGDMEVARAFVRGGIRSIGDSRIENLVKLSKGGFAEELVLLRLPQLNEAAQVVKFADTSLASEVETIKALSREAVRLHKKHNIIVMVDVGDLREGVLPDNLESFFRNIINLEGVEIKGLGTNVGCYGGVLPTSENTAILLELKRKMEEIYLLNLPVISGGNTATTILFTDDSLPAGVTNLRIGEGILQGTDITNQRLISGLNYDNFTLTASIIELKEKPSQPDGKIGCDAFGNRPVFSDRGKIKRAILAVGRQDIKIDGLKPLLENAEVLGASSDHLLVDVTAVNKKLKIGEEIEFALDYGAVLQAMTSPYIYKNYLH